MSNLLFWTLFYLVTVPGIPFASLWSGFKRRDGLSSFIWATTFGIIIWILVVILGIWVWNNVSIPFSVKH